MIDMLPENTGPAVCVFRCVCLQAVGEILSLTPCPDLDVDRFVPWCTDEGILKDPSSVHMYTAAP